MPADRGRQPHVPLPKRLQWEDTFKICRLKGLRSVLRNFGNGLFKMLMSAGCPVQSADLASKLSSWMRANSPFLFSQGASGQLGDRSGSLKTSGSRNRSTYLAPPRRLAKLAVNGGNTLLTVYRIASRLFRSGASDKATMRQFDERCLTPVKQMGASDIRQLREMTGVSQAVLARILNVTVSTVGQWERGEKRPTGSALKLLALMQSKGVGTVL